MTEDRKKLRFLAPNVVTAAALSCAMVSIVHAIAGDTMEATWWVLYAALLDRMDGAVARALRAASELGSQLDSFSDFAAFGIAPAVILLASLGEDARSWPLLAALVYVLGCALRLSRFNIKGKSDVFLGVTSTMAGGVYCLAVNVGMRHESAPRQNVALFAGLMALLGVLMNAPWMRYPKLARGPRGPFEVTVALLMMLCAVLIVTRQLPEVVLAIVATSLVSGPLLAGRASQATRPGDVAA